MSRVLSEISKTRVFGGHLYKLSHASSSTSSSMKFNVFLPPGDKRVPLVFWLSGLTCTEDNFAQKAGAFGVAARLQLAIVMPDTSPRDGVELPGDRDNWDFGVGAGFYVDATKAPFDKHYRMFSYVFNELPDVLRADAALSARLDFDRQSVMGHSMGGHGALVGALRLAPRFRCASAFAPICAPANAQCAWGQKAFAGYLADAALEGARYDASLLAAAYAGPQPLPLLVDQGTADIFLAQHQLQPDALRRAAAGNKLIELSLRMQDAYDHSYYFISTFIEEHLEFHAKHLSKD